MINKNSEVGIDNKAKERGPLACNILIYIVRYFALCKALIVLEKCWETELSTYYIVVVDKYL